MNYISAGFLLLSYLSIYISPADFWLVAFFGLIYPFLLVINILFLILWIYYKNWHFLVSLVCVIIGWNIITKHIQIPISKQSRERAFHNSLSKDSTIKVLSFNVRLFNRYNWANDKTTSDKIFELIQQNNPDILCLQEYFTTNYGKLSDNGVKNNLKQLKYSHVHNSIKTQNNSNYGIATFSRFPIIRKGIIRFEDTPNLSIFTDIVYKSDTIRIYNNHLQSIRLNKENYDFFSRLNLTNQENFEEFKFISYRLKDAFIKRALQVDLISEHLKSSNYPVVVCGDFNDTPTSYSYKKMTKNLNDAFIESGVWIGNTYIGKLPSFRIDYILSDDYFDSYNFRTHKVKLSDHYPVSCYLKIK